MGNLQSKLEEKTSDLEDKIDKGEALSAELTQYKDDYKKATQEVEMIEEIKRIMASLASQFFLKLD